MMSGKFVFAPSPLTAPVALGPAEFAFSNLDGGHVMILGRLSDRAPPLELRREDEGQYALPSRPS